MAHPYPWRNAETDPPPVDTPVLACLRGQQVPRVLEIREEQCDPYTPRNPPYRYWDDPHDDGQDFEDRVFAWQHLPPRQEELEDA